jgi:biotin carboxyl carrier protein
MRIPKSLQLLFVVALVSGIAMAAHQLRSRWWPPLTETKADQTRTDETPVPLEEPKVLKLSAQARKNLGLISKSARPQTYWRTIQIPGSIVDKPGQSDRGVTSPAVGVVAEIHAFPGETVRPGDRLFTLRLFSEYLQNTQKEFFAASQEITLQNEQLARLKSAADTGAIPQSRLIELQNQIARQETLLQSHRQDLLTRGLAPEQIAGIANGEFVSSIELTAPPLTEFGVIGFLRG